MTTGSKAANAIRFALSRRRALLGASGLMLSAKTARGEGPSRDILVRIAEARAPIRTLTGPFQQVRTIGLLATDVRSTGTMTLVRPDRLRWALAAPDDVTFWIGPEGLAYRSAHGHGSVSETNTRIAAALDDLRTLLGGDLQNLRARWSLRVLRDDVSGAELEATPRVSVSQRAGGLRSMRFALAADLVRPIRVVLVESERDHTTIDFGKLVVDAPVNNASMRGD